MKSGFFGLCFALVGTIFGNHGWAESSGTRGGGDVLVCKLIASGIALTKAHLADTFRMKVRDQIKDLGVFDQLSEKKLESVLWKSLEKKYPAKYKELLPHYRMLQFDEVASVPEVDDDDLKDLPPECSKQQLAVQYFKAKGKSLVQMAQPVLAQISKIERRLVRIHEAYLHKEWTENPDYENTRGVRARVLGIMTDEGIWDSIIRELYFSITGRASRPEFGPNEAALVDAVLHQRHDEVSRLLANPRIRINAANTGGYTALDFAGPGTVDLLLEKGAQFNRSRTVGGGPISRFAAEGDLPGIQRLMELGAVPTCVRVQQECGLAEAIRKNHVPIFDFLLPYPLESPHGVFVESVCSENPYYLARLFERYPKQDLDQIAGDQSLLHAAARCGRLHSVQTLLDRGARVNLRLPSAGDATPYQIARRYGHLPLSEYLRSRGGILGPSLSSAEAALAFRRLVSDGRINEAIALIEEGLDPDLFTQGEWAFAGIYREGSHSPLMILAVRGHLRGIETALAHGGQVNRRDEGKNTSLHYAARGGHLEAVKRLVQVPGLWINAVNAEGQTPLTLAKTPEVRDFLRQLGGLDAVE